MKIDTHVHTTCSDGRKTVGAIIELAAGLGIRMLAITDHDTVNAYPEAFIAAEMWSVNLIPGVELSTRDEDGHKEVHVLGLKVDVDNPRLRQELQKLAEARIDARRRLLENANAYLAAKYEGWQPVRFEDVRRNIPGNIVGKPHLARAIIEHAKASGISINEEELFGIFRLPEVKTQKAYELTMAECIDLVRHAGGVPTLAHPCEYERPGEVMEKFVRLGGEATEICKYRYKTKMPAISGIPPDDRISTERGMNEETLRLAKKYGLKLTASSDYHGRTGEPGMETDEYGIDVGWLLT